MDKTYLWHAALVGLGGSVGAVLRFALSGLVHRLLPSVTLPIGTLCVNVAGCLVIGFLGGLVETRQVFGPQSRIFLFIGESDRHEGRPLYEWIVLEARRLGMAGATVLRGLEGYGAHSRLHTAKVLRLSSDLPIVVEIVETREKIESLIPVIDSAIGEGLVTIEPVEIRLYRSRKEPADDE